MADPTAPQPERPTTVRCFQLGTAPAPDPGVPLRASPWGLLVIADLQEHFSGDVRGLRETGESRACVSVFMQHPAPTPDPMDPGRCKKNWLPPRGACDSFCTWKDSKNALTSVIAKRSLCSSSLGTYVRAFVRPDAAKGPERCAQPFLMLS